MRQKVSVHVVVTPYGIMKVLSLLLVGADRSLKAVEMRVFNLQLHLKGPMM
jgi:hypothetical protein